MPTPKKDNVASMYSTLSHHNYDLPDIDGFREMMKDKGQLLSARQALIDEGYNPPAEDEFLSAMGYAESAPPSAPSNTAESQQSEVPGFKHDWQTDAAYNQTMGKANAFQNLMNKRTEGAKAEQKHQMQNPMETPSQFGIPRPEMPKSLDTRLREAYDERDRLDKAVKDRVTAIDEEYNNAGFLEKAARELAMSSRAGLDHDITGEDTKYNQDEEYMKLMAAYRKNKQTINTLENEKQHKDNNFWRSMGQEIGVGYIFNPMAKYRDSYALMRAASDMENIRSKKENGIPLTDAEKADEALVNDYFNNEAVNQLYGLNDGSWSNYGKMGAQALDFMLSMATTPGWMGLSKAVAKPFFSVAAKKAGDAAMKAAAKFAARNISKLTGITAGSLAAGTYTTNSPYGAANVAQTAADEYYRNGMNELAPAILEAERAWIGENATEALGGFLPGGSVALKAMDKIGLSKISNFMRGLGKKEFYQVYSKFIKSAGWSGAPGEAIEEYAMFPYDAATGHAEEVWKDFTNLQTHIDIWLGTAVISVMLGAVPGVVQGYHTKNHFKYKRRLEKSESNASDTFAESQFNWDLMRDVIDNTDNGAMTNVLSKMINDNNLSREQAMLCPNTLKTS